MNQPKTSDAAQENQPPDARRRRLYYRSAHRGNKEMDLLLGPYAKTHLPGMTEAQLDVFEALLEEDDYLLWDWVVGNKPLSKPEYAAMIEQLRHQAQR